jgi:adenylate cyclase
VSQRAALSLPDRLRRGWRNVRAAGPRRLAVTGLLLFAALLVARLSWAVPVLGDAERGLYDLRFALNAPQRAPDPRLVIVPYKDETLIATRKRSPLDRALLARALTALDAMGARAIGVDILIDQRNWSLRCAR